MAGATDEYNEILDSIRDYLDFYYNSGILHISKTSAPAPDMEAEIAEDWTVTEGFDMEKGFGAVFGVWKSGEALFVDAVEAAPGGAPFSGEEGEQLEKIIRWFAGEIDASPIDMNPSYTCSVLKKDPPFDPLEAIRKVEPLLRRYIEGVSPRLVVAFGPLAADALLGSSDIQKIRGRFHPYGSCKLIPTHGLSDMVRNQALKKETFEDMKTVIRVLKS